MAEYLDKDKTISTHTPTRGVTEVGALPINYPVDFNSHAHEGRDLFDTTIANGLKISTHTPTRGVTTGTEILYTLYSHFNSHAHEGRD